MKYRDRLVLVATVVAVLGVDFTPRPRSQLRLALAAARPPFPFHATERSCPLSMSQQIKAVKAFAEMMPVFRHPRCFNCHGGFDIRSDQHEGSDFAKNTGLDPRALLTAPQRKALHAGCDNCHTEVRGGMTRLDGTQLAGWLVAPRPMLWDGKDNDSLCVEMKAFERTGDQFVDHIQNDHGEVQFIEAAFKGHRALSAEDLKRYNVVIAKPPGTQADLVAKAKKWVQLVGDGYTASPECGCVLPKIKLEVRHRSEIDPNHIAYRGGEIGYSGEAIFEAILTPMEGAEGYYEGRVSLTRPLRVNHATRACTGTASQKEDWTFIAQVDTGKNEMTLQSNFLPSEQKGVSVCRVGGIVDRAELDPSMYSDLEKLVIPLDTSATKQSTKREPDGMAQETFVVKVRAVPRKQ